MITLASLSKSGMFWLDVEYGNASCFYSGVKQEGLNHLGGAFERSESFTWGGELVNTCVELTDRLTVSDKRLERELLFDLKAGSRLFDFVSRFVVYSYDSRPGRISGKEFYHCSSNIYRQFPIEGEVSVPVGRHGRLRFDSLGGEVPKGFNEVFYIRDEGRDERGYRWIVHHRLIVDPSQVRLVVRSCNPRFEGPIPFEEFLPRFIKKLLFRIREARFPNFPIMSVGEACLPVGTHASLRTSVEFLHD